MGWNPYANYTNQLLNKQENLISTFLTYYFNNTELIGKVGKDKAIKLFCDGYGIIESEVQRMENEKFWSVHPMTGYFGFSGCCISIPIISSTRSYTTGLYSHTTGLYSLSYSNNTYNSYVISG